jgi:hypothetical protein
MAAACGQSHQAYQGARYGKGDLKFFGRAKNFTGASAPDHPLPFAATP